MARRRPVGILAAACVLGGLAAIGRAADAPPAPMTGPEILQELKSFRTMATVLMVAAHPDDENTNLISYLARGRAYRMGYLSVTRGNGGQNLLGGEFGDELGLIRTNELLAARSLDSGRQFFTRAIDFGYSKSPDETLKIWDRDAVTADVVRVIRLFRPDVVVTRFSPQTQQGQHGHHTASAVLAVDAFKLAGDPTYHPEQVRELGAWQPKRVLLNGGGGGRGGAAGGGGVQIDAGGTDPVLKETYSQIAGRSRAMHKSQGFGQGGGGGRGGGRGGAVNESFSLLAGEAAGQDIMDGVDTTWARVPGGADVGKMADDVIAKFDATKTEASVNALLEIKKKLAGVHDKDGGERILDEKRLQLDRLIAGCLGLTAQTTVPSAEVLAGDTLQLEHTVRMTTNIPVKWVENRFPAGGAKTLALQPNRELKPNQIDGLKEMQILPAETPVSQPYWMREPSAEGIYTVKEQSLIGLPMNFPAFPIEHVFEVGGQQIVLQDEPVQLVAGGPAAQQRRKLDVIAPVTVAFPFEVRLFNGGKARSVDVEVTAYREKQAGAVKLNVPPGWKVEPSTQPFNLAAVGNKAKVTFTVTPAADMKGATLTAEAVVGGKAYNTSRNEIKYEHLPVLLVQPTARLAAVPVDLKIKGQSIAYLAGAGDSVAESLTEMGYHVHVLDKGEITADNLKQFDAVVIGVRAFNTRDDLGGNGGNALAGGTLKEIFDYVEQGGTVVEQYNRPDGLRNNTLAPFPLTLSSQRVTDENAKITPLVPDHAALNTPNKITDADFANWVQERSIYLPNQWDPRFTPILQAADPGESPPNSALLIANHGKGHFVYTSLVFFRQLPAGNPGAYRLFANLVSLGK